MLLEKEPVVPVTHIDQVIPSLESSIKAPFPFESVISSHPENHVMSTGCQVLVASFKTASVVLGDVPEVFNGNKLRSLIMAALISANFLKSHGFSGVFHNRKKEMSFKP